ncbi:MAG: hypothetical protein CW716_10925 [Candidatus Bathyarchaeum sp.]|nr:MAG: hypothetical protein CW716_10925 [Candidatus Bathyarchaeum sp.]
MPKQFEAKQIAQCGINCKTCIDFFGYTMAGTKRKHGCCSGCRTRNSSCAFIKQKCKRVKAKEHVDYCFECSDFPCEALTKLDQTYRKKYDMSLIENLNNMKAVGMDKYLESEEQKWKCSVCGGVVCVHTKKCYACNL